MVVVDKLIPWYSEKMIFTQASNEYSSVSRMCIR